MTQQDKLYCEEVKSIQNFEFNAEVASVFDDMVTRSVPLYQEVQGLTVRIANKFAQPNSNIYDLGCSTGTTLIELGQALQTPEVKLIGVDNSAPMLAECREKLNAAKLYSSIELKCEDITALPLTNASMVIMNYSLQFVKPLKRQQLLKNIYNTLLPGGVLLISEKTIHRDKSVNAILTKLYYDFKSRMGYSKLEIAQKREALEGILVPYSIKENFDMLSNAGFSSLALPLKLYNFATFLAVKKTTTGDKL